MYVENILAKASEHLSVRRAFGTAYEKGRHAHHPGRAGGRRRRRGHGHSTYPQR